MGRRRKKKKPEDEGSASPSVEGVAGDKKPRVSTAKEREQRQKEERERQMEEQRQKVAEYNRRQAELKKRIKNWVCVYPAYVNAKLTLNQGRRVAQEACPDNPTPRYIFEAVRRLNFETVLEEGKAYPKDILQRGRVRVLFKSPEGVLVHPEIPNRRELFKRIASETKKVIQESSSSGKGKGKKKKRK